MYYRSNQYTDICGQNRPLYNPYGIMYDNYLKYLYNLYQYSLHASANQGIQLKEHGREPFVFNIENATEQNDNFRTALWTGDHLQLTLMSLDVGEDIGVESHPNLDQFIRVENGQGIVRMGDEKDNMNFQENVKEDYAIIIPAGKWHNIINTGNEPMKMYSIYAPTKHPYGTVHKTKQDAEEAERNMGD